MAKTKEDLQADIKALKDAGLSADEEEAKLKAMVLAEGTTTPPKAKAKVATPAPEEEGDFISLNVESFKTGGGGWIAPETIGVKDAICEGYLIPDFVEDQLWFIFGNVKGAEEQFRGALVCGALHGEPGKGGAWKVKEVLDALTVPYEETANGIKLLSSPKGKTCQVMWDDISIRGKTQRRIQDALLPGAEVAM